MLWIDGSVNYVSYTAYSIINRMKNVLDTYKSLLLISQRHFFIIRTIGMTKERPWNNRDNYKAPMDQAWDRHCRTHIQPTYSPGADRSIVCALKEYSFI